MARTPQEAEDLIARYAARQRGNVTRRQLIEAGVSSGAIQRRLRRGSLRRMLRGVYFAGHGPRPPLALEAAAVLACGPQSMIGDESAAGLWEFPVPYSGAIRVTVVGRDIRGPAGVVVREIGHLATGELRRIKGVPVTSPALTLLDLAGTQPERTLAAALNEARATRIVREEELEAVLRSHPNRRGARAFAALLGAELAVLATESEAEARCLSLMREHGLEPTGSQVRIGPYRVDFLFREAKVIVEVEGYRYHGTRHRFVRDRRRAAYLASRGYVVFPITWSDLVDRPEKTMRALAATLAARPGMK
jgi:very-short-patch-repair endonuclease